MAEGELEQQHEKDVTTVIGGGGIGSRRHASLKNGFKGMAPAEVLLQSVVDSNGILKGNVELGKATKEVHDEGAQLKHTEPKGADIGKQTGFSKKHVHDLKALLQALTLISRNLPLPATLLDEVQSINYPPNVHRVQKGVIGEDQKAYNSDIQDHSSHDGSAAVSKSRASSPVLVEEQDLTTSSVELRASEGTGEACDGGTDDKENGVRIAKTEGLEDYLEVELFDGDDGKLLTEFEDAVAAQRPHFMSSKALRDEKDRRIQSQLANRILELEDVSSDVCDDIRTKRLLELHTLKLLGLQLKVRSEVMVELQLQQLCARPDTSLLDWGLMRIRRRMSSLSGMDASVIAGVSSTESDERLRRKRKAERQRRIEEEEKTRVSTRKRKFFNELLNLVREFVWCCLLTLYEENALCFQCGGDLSFASFEG